MAKKSTTVHASTSGTPHVPTRHGKTHRSSPNGAEGRLVQGSATRPAKAVTPAAECSSLSGLDAAHAVLVSAGTPMNVQSITKAIFAKKLWTTSGKTPHATIASAIMREIAQKADASRFVKAGRGLFAARSNRPANTSPTRTAKTTRPADSSQATDVSRQTTNASAAIQSASEAMTSTEPSAKGGLAKKHARVASTITRRSAK